MKGLNISVMLVAMAALAYSQDSCLSDKPKASCRAAFPRFYFDQTQKRCKEYMGCQFLLNSVTNDFATVEECQKTCDQYIDDPCYKSRYQGSCRSLLPHYYFKASTNSCVRSFGCPGPSNGQYNNFHFSQQCEASCRSPVK